MAYKIDVIKVPRSDPIQEKTISFPEFYNLRLDLLESKRKLLKGLPLLPPVPKRPKPAIKDIEEENQRSDDIEDVDSIEIPAHKSSKKNKKKKKKVKIVEDDFMKQFGDDAESEKTDDDEEDVVEESDDEVEVNEDDEEDGSGGEAEGEGSEKEDVGEKKKEEEKEFDPYAGLSPEQREEKEKEEYLWKFYTLKKKYKDLIPADDPIPPFNKLSDLNDMKLTYERTLRKLALDDNYQTYRTWLVYGFMGVEFVCTTFIGIDMSGFTMHQKSVMPQYDRLLLELGERPYNSWSMMFPVEVRLMGLILFQAAVFYIGKAMMGAMGGKGGFSKFMKDFLDTKSTTEPNVSAATNMNNEKPSPKRGKMRGPSISPNYIKNLPKDEEESDKED